MSSAETTVATTVATDAPVTETTPAQELQDRLTALQAGVREFADSQRTVLRELASALTDVQKQLKKVVKASQKKTKRRATVSQSFKFDEKTAKSLSKIGLKGDTFTRLELMKGVCEYISSKNLKNDKKKTVWVADATLARVLGIQKGDENTHLRVNKLISPLVNAATKVPRESS